jgi:hypothetical protein
MYRYFSLQKFLDFVEALLEVVLFTLNYYQRRKEVRTDVLCGLLSNQVYFEELFANFLWAETYRLHKNHGFLEQHFNSFVFIKTQET